MTQGNRVIEHLDDRGVPVPSLAVVEHAVPARHQVVAVTLGDAGGDGQRRSIAAAAGTINDAKIAARGDDGVAGGIVHLDA